MSAAISIQAKTWLRMEMSASVLPVAICRDVLRLGSTRFAVLVAHCASPMAGAAGAGARAALRDLDRDAVRQPVGALHDHHLAGLDAREDLHDAGARAQADLRRAQRALSCCTT